MVSIITINYNGWQDTCQLLASLKQHETYSYEVIVVDNASRGDDVLQIKTLFPEVTVVCSKQNLGFAVGNNLGCKQAKGEYLFFLNNDTMVQKPILEALVKHLEEPEVGGVSPMIQRYNPPYDIQYFGYQKMTPITLKHTTAPYDATCPEKYLIDRETDIIHGAAMMLPRRVIEKVGMMAECFFLYYEEFDWSYRISAHGYRLWYEPAALILHKEGTKKDKALTPFREYYLVRSRILFARRNLRGMDKFLSCCYLLGVVMLRNIVQHLLQGQWKSLRVVVTGTFSGLFSSKTKPLILRR